LRLKDKLKSDKEALEDKVNALTKHYDSEKKEREKLEEAIQRQQNETGLNLVTLRKRLQSYVWEDMYIWKVLLDMKVDFELEDFHREKLSEIADHEFSAQVDKIDGDIKLENNRLIELAAERQRESMAAKNELMLGDDDEDDQSPKSSGKEGKDPSTKESKDPSKKSDRKKKKKKE